MIYDANKFQVFIKVHLLNQQTPCKRKLTYFILSSLLSFLTSTVRNVQLCFVKSILNKIPLCTNDFLKEICSTTN